MLSPSRTLQVLATGAQVLVQDEGRVGYAHLGVPRAGALDAPAAALANRLVGNTPRHALLEVLLGGLVLRADAACWVAITGAPVPVSIDEVAVAHTAALRLRPGATLRLGTPPEAMRSYLAVGGGIAVPPVLGSRSTDTLAGVGPAAVRAGDVLPVGDHHGAPAGLDTPRAPRTGGVRVLRGPHPQWFPADALAQLTATRWRVAPASDRVGLRLAGPSLGRSTDELPSEGTVLGAVQVPPDGQPVVLLADHGPTGGYPVVAVVHPDDLWQLAQLRPGEYVTLRPDPAPDPAPDLPPARA